MFKLLLVLNLSVVLHVQTQSNWFYDMDDDWEISNRLTSDNPYYGWYKQAAKQMDMYGYAKHVGKINRGQFSNPEQNLPADRAFSHQSDFNPNEVNSGAFNYKPQGQRFRAKAVEDETILAQTPLAQTAPYTYKMRGPSTPCDMCTCTCTAVKEFTATCSRNKNYKLTLNWFNPGAEKSHDDYDDDYYYDYYGYDDGAEKDLLLLVPAFHDGDHCDYFDYDSYYFLSADTTACGVVFDDYETGEEFATLTMLNHAIHGQTKYQDYTYAVIARRTVTNFLSDLNPTLTVEYDGVIEQTLTIPTRADSPDVEASYFFFGCFRPQFGFVDTHGAGFYERFDDVVDDLKIHHAGLCKELDVLDS